MIMLCSECRQTVLSHTIHHLLFLQFDFFFHLQIVVPTPELHELPGLSIQEFPVAVDVVLLSSGSVLNCLRSQLLHR